MDTFLMICYVAADFGPYKGEIFRVTPDKLGIFIQAPAWIKKTIMYKWLLSDGSIVISAGKEQQKQLENDPMEGVNAEGKAMKTEPEEPEKAEEPKEPVSVKTATRKTKKGEAK